MANASLPAPATFDQTDQTTGHRARYAPAEADAPTPEATPGAPSTAAAVVPRGRTSEQAWSPVLEQLRAASQAARQQEATAARETSAATVDGHRRAIVDMAMATTPSTPSAAQASMVVPDATVTAPGSRTASDAGGDGAPDFAFTHHGAARLAMPAGVAPPPAANFAALVNTAMPATDVLPAETSTQIVQAIRLQILRDGGEAHIRLDPRQFGDMSVRIRVDQGQVTARVEADTPVVREWLQSNQHVLRQSLAGQQLTLDRLDVHEPPSSSPDDRRDESSGREQDRQQRGQRRRRPDSGQAFDVVA